MQQINPKQAYSVREASKTIGIGRDGVYREIREGRLVARKCGHRTLILHVDLERYLNELPPYATPPIGDAR